MVLKSQKGTARKRNVQCRYNPLFLQKQAISNAMFNSLGVSVLFFVLAIVLVILEFHDGAPSLKIVYFHGLLAWCAFLCFFILFIRYFIIFRKVSKIKFTSEQCVSMYCKKITFILQPISKNASAILCIILKDKSGNKFYYVYPEKTAPSDLAKKHIKEQYIGKQVELICYKNTNIVKALPY